MKVKIKYPETKCAYCGETFKKKHNRQIYCSKQCAENSRKEKRRIYDHKYYTENKNRINHKRLGTRTIGANRNPNVERESEIIQNEIERIGLRITSF